MRRDLRFAAILATAGAILAVGLAVSLAPPGGTHAAPAPREVPVVAPEHAAQVDTSFRQGVVMLHAKRYEHAIAAFHHVLRFAPRMPEAHVNMGYALAGLGRYAAARDFFESAMALRPRQANAYYGLAVALESLGDHGGAIGAMRSFLHLAERGDPYRRRAEAALWEWESARDAVSKVGTDSRR